MVVCKNRDSFSHDSMKSGSFCPLCNLRIGSEGLATAGTPEVEEIAAVPTLAVSTTSSQHTPLLNNLAWTLGKVNTHRNDSIKNQKTTQPTSGKVYLFIAQVAIADTKATNTRTSFIIHAESWNVSIFANTTFRFWKFVDAILDSGRGIAMSLPHLSEALYPRCGSGEWMVATNHLTQKAPSPKLLTPWSIDPMLIQDIIKRGGYKPKNKKDGDDYEHEITMIWYPSNDKPADAKDTEEPLPNLEDLVSTPINTTSGHKRGISDVAPAIERPNGRENDAERGDGEAGAGDSEIGGPRRSGRPKKMTAKVNSHE